MAGRNPGTHATSAVPKEMHHRRIPRADGRVGIGRVNGRGDVFICVAALPGPFSWSCRPGTSG